MRRTIAAILTNGDRSLQSPLCTGYLGGLPGRRARAPDASPVGRPPAPIARFVISLAGKNADRDIRIEPALVNGSVGALLYWTANSITA